MMHVLYLFYPQVDNHFFVKLSVSDVGKKIDRFYAYINLLEGETGRLRNQSISSLLFTTETSTISSKRPTRTTTTTTEKIVITNSTSLIFTQQLLTSSK
jgi:hypothetical protein